MIINYSRKTNFENNVVEYVDASKSSGAIKNACESNASTISIIGSQFINCKSNNYVVYVVTGQVDVDNINITFYDSNNACGGINLGNKGFNLFNAQITRTGNFSGAFF